ncbi:MAG: ATP-binding cassette domain-containing protein [Actinocrinis sp.]
MSPDTQAPALRLEGISKSFGVVRALADVSLEIRSGRVHALLGENGAGKSTLMAVACGSTRPDEGRIVIGGTAVEAYNPDLATRHGIAIVHQHPAVLPDMTVAENLRIAIPSSLVKTIGDQREWMAALLARIGSHVRLSDRVEQLSVAQKQLLEVAKAIALEPSVLILDEPTAPLGADQSEILFAQIREAAARGTAVVYITHRLAEVRQIADEVTVLRDGRSRGSAPVAELTDAEMLRLIVGRELASTFPDKPAPHQDQSPVLHVDGMSGDGFGDVRLSARRGEIVGLAGIVGNGQSDFLRALAGLRPSTGPVALAGERVNRRDLGRAVAYMPADRHREGLMRAMSVRENAAVAALPAVSRFGIVSRSREHLAVREEIGNLAIKTASPDANVMALSGGNQQKVVMARALLAAPKMLLADEPTQGVDVGARSEIYEIMRRVAREGVPVLVVCSDAKELEGLCDRVLIFSRGHVVGELAGDEVTEENITTCVVQATAVRHDARRPERRERQRPANAKLSLFERLGKLARGDYAPSIILAVVIAALAAYTYSQNARYLAPFNVSAVLILMTALAFISMGQQIVIMTGGIDLSVGPLAGLLVVIASFFVNDGKSGIVIFGALVLMAGVGAASGLVNGLLVRFGGFTAVAATLTLYIGLQGVSLLLRPFQGGYINSHVTDVLTKNVGSFPIAFLVAVVVAIGLELALRFTRWGRELRAVGSDEQSAHRLGVRVNRTHVLAYVACGLLTFVGALLLMAQIGVGDPTQGVTFTLTSITAVVLGGASLLGGRGSFIGTLLGAALIQQILNATTFLNLSQTWQYFFQGILILVAAAIYTQARGHTRLSA